MNGVGPFISIITPTYNSEDRIEKCVTSVANQIFKNYEHIIVDGRSRDRTTDIVFQLANIYPNIKVTSEPDQGVYDAMNKGISLAKGQWIYFLGSDDYLYDEQVLQNIFKILDRSNEQVIYGNVVSTRFKGVYDGAFTVTKLLNQNICHQSIFFSKKLFGITGLFNLKYSIKADYDHNLRWFLDPSIKKRHVDKIIAYYSDGGLSSVNEDHNFRFDFFRNLLEYGKETLSNSLKCKLAKDQGYLYKQKGLIFPAMKYYLRSINYKIKSLVNGN